MQAAKRRSPASFFVSLCLHGGVLGWVVFSPAGSGERPKSLYEREIQPYEKKIVWYRLSDRLPEIANSTSRDPRPERAREKAVQSIVAGEKDEDRPTPKIYLPEPAPPQPAAPQPAPLPNAIALAAPPKVLRPFVAPVPLTPAAKDPVLPDAPRVEAIALKAAPLPIAVSLPKLPRRAFVPPPEVRMQRQAALPLPESPAATAMVVEPNALPFSMAVPKPRRPDFVPPLAAKMENTAMALPAAPEAIPATLAIVGLNPGKTMEMPKPPAESAGGFSAGPVLRKDGGDGGANPDARLSVPGLSVKGAPVEERRVIVAGFSPTSRENLMAAARADRMFGAPAPAPKTPGAVRVAEPPDPRLAGRAVYSMAIQMPNITSFSGSWLVWFAEHAPPAGLPAVEIKPPVPLRKVDPRYVAAAMAERIEGTVRLWALIHKDGHVEVLSVVRNLDARLDLTACEALAKWEFTPATRSGIPVDVDAVFEIPFHLAPRPAR